MSIAMNLAMALLVAPVLAGIVRKYVRALVHSRQGPPLLQPYYDLAKLLGKEDLRTSPAAIINYAPTVVLAAMMTAALLIPMGVAGPFHGHGDMALLIYMLTLAAVATIIVGTSSRSPYSMMHSATEIISHVLVEPVLVLCLLTAALKANSVTLWDIAVWNATTGPAWSMVVAGIALALALIAQIGRLPFDAPEADTEIMDGPLAELSGPRLAQLQLASLVKQVIYASVLVGIFVPWGIELALPLSLLVHALKVAVVIVLLGLIDVVNPRLRAEQTMRFYVFILILGIGALGLAAAGL